MKQMTDKERQFLIDIAEAIQQLGAANEGILTTLKNLDDEKIVLSIIPFTQKIGGELLKLLTITRHYSEVHQSDLTSVS